MKTKHFFAMLLVLVAALPLIAQAPNPPERTVVVVPSVPFTGQPISIAWTDDCVADVTVQRNGNAIRAVVDYNPCNPPQPRRFEAPVGALPAGIYNVTVVNRGGEVVASGQFQVLAPGQQRFTVHPSIVPSGVAAPLPVVLRSTTQSRLCPQSQCTVRVGNVAVQKSVDAQGNVIITPPALPAGEYDITVDSALEQLVVQGAIYYFNRDAAPDPAHFERILFPVLFNAPGANGSLWRTEAAISNPEPWALETYNDIGPRECVAYPCGARLAAATKARYDGGDYPRGVALLVPRREADNLAFALRVRDVSRVAETYGTEIPVVREADMYKNVAITLPDVPVDPRFRVRVRVYAFDSQDAAPGVINGHNMGRTVKTVQQFGLTRSCSSVRDCAAVPWSAEVEILPGTEGERRNLYVHVPQGTTAWAFATVTNNRTQEVTIVRPSGTGGEPCLPCPTP